MFSIFKLLLPKLKIEEFSILENLEGEELNKSKIEEFTIDWQFENWKIEELKYGSESDLQREQKTKCLFFGLNESSHTKIYCFYIACWSTDRNVTWRRAACRRPAVVFDFGLVGNMR